MSKVVPLPPPGFDDLPVEEQIDYLQSLWERIAAHPDRVPVPQWHRDLIAQRMAEHRANPDDATSWEEVRDALGKELDRKPE